MTHEHLGSVDSDGHRVTGTCGVGYISVFLAWIGNIIPCLVTHECGKACSNVLKNSERPSSFDKRVIIADVPLYAVKPVSEELTYHMSYQHIYSVSQRYKGHDNIGCTKNIDLPGYLSTLIISFERSIPSLSFCCISGSGDLLGTM